MDEGFLEARPCSGVFVAPNARPPSAAQAGPLAGASGLPVQPPDWPARVLRSLVGQPTLAQLEQWRAYPYPFVYGTHDPRRLPTEDVRECCARSLARSRARKRSSSRSAPSAPATLLVEALFDARSRVGLEAPGDCCVHSLC